MSFTLETRRITLLGNMASRLATVEGMKTLFEVMNYKWKDYEDYTQKCQSRNDVNAAAKRQIM